MKRLRHNDDSWRLVQDEWSKQCHEYDEDFESYMSSTIPMLAEQIVVCDQDRWSGVYASQGLDGSTEAICFLNGAFIPKFAGRVLRVRNLILAPKYDFGDHSNDEYAALLSRVFENVLKISDSELSCPHVKFHFRSPADATLFREFATEMSGNDHFSHVKMVGAWLFVSKR